MVKYTLGLLHETNAGTQRGEYLARDVMMTDLFVSTSDSPPHTPPRELSTDMVIQVIANMTQTITKHFPNLTVYPALGNHDHWPQVLERCVL